MFNVLFHRDVLMKHGVKVRVLGNLEMLPKDVATAIARAMDMTKDNTR